MEAALSPLSNATHHADIMARSRSFKTASVGVLSTPLQPLSHLAHSQSVCNRDEDFHLQLSYTAGDQIVFA